MVHLLSLGFLILHGLLIPSSTAAIRRPRSSTTTCDVTTIKSSLENGNLTINGTIVNSSVSASTTLTIVCDTSYSLGYGITTSFTCSQWNSEYSCRSNCVIQLQNSGTTTLSPIVVVGTVRNLTHVDEILHGETISVECASNTTTAERSTNTTQLLTCDVNKSGKYLRVSECKPTCSASSLSGLTNNTSITPSPLVGVGQKVTLVCQENFISVTSVNVTDITCLYNSTNSSSAFSSLVIPSGDQCYALPIVKVVASGDKQVEISASVDQRYDRNGPTLEKVLYRIENLTIRTLYNMSEDSLYSTMETGWKYTNTSVDYGTPLKVTVQLHYSGLSGPLIGFGRGTMGPPPITAKEWIVKFTGTTVLEIWFTNLSRLKQLYPTITFRIELISGVLRLGEIREELVMSVTSKLDRQLVIGNMNYVGDEIMVPAGILLEDQSCTVRVTSLNGKLTGGSANFSSIIGLSAPSLIGIDESVHSARIKFYHPLLHTSTHWAVILNDSDITYGVTNTDNIGDVVLGSLLSSRTYIYMLRLKGPEGNVSESCAITFTTLQAFTEDPEQLGLLIALIVIVMIVLILFIIIIIICCKCSTSNPEQSNTDLIMENCDSKTQ